MKNFYTFSHKVLYRITVLKCWPSWIFDQHVKKINFVEDHSQAKEILKTFFPKGSMSNVDTASENRFGPMTFAIESI